MIQVRNVPEELHRQLKVRAAQEGVTLSELALRELARSVDVPTARVLSERFATMVPQSETAESITESVRAERDAR
ncbi:FitA-like ribbon-helix-helix domain-containing protein [Corynebacterium terpenotabidum]|nr:hypothetical protein [Corynebacterium terpenotabidum]